MKTKILVTFMLLISFSLMADDSKITYALESRNIVYKSHMLTYIILTVKNNSQQVLNFRGYGSLAECFSAKDEKGNQIKDSFWVERLRCKKREERPVIIPANGQISIMYTLGQLFTLSQEKELTVSLWENKELTVIIKQPIYCNSNKVASPD